MIAQIHVGIVDSESCHGREQMLDGGDVHIAGTQAGGQGGATHVLRTGLDLDDGIEVHPPETNTVVGGCGPQCEVDFLAGMQADAGGTNNVFQRALPNH
jgi:hypothetical protein